MAVKLPTNLDPVWWKKHKAKTLKPTGFEKALKAIHQFGDASKQPPDMLAKALEAANQAERIREKALKSCNKKLHGDTLKALDAYRKLLDAQIKAIAEAQSALESAAAPNGAGPDQAQPANTGGENDEGAPGDQSRAQAPSPSGAPQGTEGAAPDGRESEGKRSNPKSLTPETDKLNTGGAAGDGAELEHGEGTLDPERRDQISDSLASLLKSGRELKKLFATLNKNLDSLEKLIADAMAAGDGRKLVEAAKVLKVFESKMGAKFSVF